MRPRSPVQAEAMLASGVPATALDLLDWERDVLILHNVIPGNRDEAILRLSTFPPLLPTGHISDGDELWERLSDLTVAIAEMKVSQVYLPGLFDNPRLENDVLLIPMAMPSFRTRVREGHVHRHKMGECDPGRKRRVPLGIETCPWEWPWIYLMRRYLPWKLGLFDGKEGLPVEIPDEDVEERTGRHPPRKRAHGDPDEGLTPHMGECYGADATPSDIEVQLVDGGFAHHVLNQLSVDEIKWLRLRWRGCSPEQAARLFNLGPEAGWQRDKRLRDKIERLEGGQTIRKVFTKGAQMSTAAVSEIKAHVDQRFDQLERLVVGAATAGERGPVETAEEILSESSQVSCQESPQKKL